VEYIVQKRIQEVFKYLVVISVGDKKWLHLYPDIREQDLLKQGLKLSRKPFHYNESATIREQDLLNKD